MRSFYNFRIRRLRWDVSTFFYFTNIKFVTILILFIYINSCIGDTGFRICLQFKTFLIILCIPHTYLLYVVNFLFRSVVVLRLRIRRPFRWTFYHPSVYAIVLRYYYNIIYIVGWYAQLIIVFHHSCCSVHTIQKTDEILKIGHGVSHIMLLCIPRSHVSGTYLYMNVFVCLLFFFFYIYHCKHYDNYCERFTHKIYYRCIILGIIRV